MIDAMGVTGYEGESKDLRHDIQRFNADDTISLLSFLLGVFRRTAEIALRILRENKDSLVSVLEAMVHDPLVEWGADNRGRKVSR